MSDQRQTVHAGGISRLTLDLSGADVSVRWMDTTDEITIIGAELPVDRAGDEIFIRTDLRGSREVHEDDDVEIRIPDLDSPGKIVEDILKQTGLFGGFGRGRKRTPVHLQLPVSLQSVTLEIGQGDLSLDNPQNKVDCKLKRGSLTSSGGNAELHIASGSGDVHVASLEGSVRAAGGSGDITLVDVRAITNIKAGSGAVSLTRVTADAIKLTAGSGDLDVIDCRADAYSSECGSGDLNLSGGYLERISIRTGSGDISCTAHFGASTQSISTGSGSVSLGVPKDLSARIEAFTSGGDIDTDLPLVSVGQRGPKSRRSRRQVGSVGTGEPRAEVSVRTSSGDIRLHWLQRSAPAAIPMPPPVPEPPKPPDPPTPPTPPQPGPRGAASVQADADNDTDTAEPSDEWQQVLESLAKGEITVEEADALLDTIEAQKSKG